MIVQFTPLHQIGFMIGYCRSFKEFYIHLPFITIVFSKLRKSKNCTTEIKYGTKTES